MANPDGAAVKEVVKAVLRHAYVQRFEGITFGGDHLLDDSRRLTAELSHDISTWRKARRCSWRPSVTPHGDCTTSTASS